jgi:hypothetical protein
LGDEDGDFVILNASKDLKVLSEANVGAPILSTPIVANGVMYVASQTHLYGFYDAARSAANPDQVPKVDVRK